MKRRIFSLLAALALFCALSITAYAYETPQDIPGSISVIMRYDGELIPGGELTCYRVGYIYEEDGSYSFRRLLDDEPLEEVQSAKLAEELAEYAEKNKDKLYHKTLEIGKSGDGKGKVVFDGLETGLYVLVQEKAAEGYSAVKPFLVGVPNNEDGEYVYDVVASSKAQPTPEETKPTTAPTKETEPTLPQTGQLNWPVPLMVVLGMGFFVVGWMMRFNRKKDGYEE